MSARLFVRGASVAMTAALGIALLVPTAALSSIEGEFSGSGSAELLYVDLLNGESFGGPAGGYALQAHLAQTDIAVDNTGALPDGNLSSADANGVDVSVGGQGLVPDPIPLTARASQVAPPDNTEPATETLIDLSAADPLLGGSIETASAFARDPNAIGCDDLDENNRVAISDAFVTTTNAAVLNAGDFFAVAVADSDGTVDTRSTTYVTGDGAVVTESYTQTASINLGGEQLLIEVVNPSLIATATGHSGGATVEYTGEVRVNNEKVAGIQTYSLSLDIFGPDAVIPLDFLEEFNANAMVATVTVADLASEVAADGTSASGSVSVVKVEVFPAALGGDPIGPALITLDYSPLTAAATVPVGGVNINCGEVQDPFDEVAKDVTAARVRPGTAFDYVLTVPNRAECTVTDVVVTDTVTGPAGFVIESTIPEGTIDGATITWDVDKIEPNETRTFQIKIRVPDSAVNGERFVDTLGVTGICDGEEVDGEDELDMPVVTTDKALGCDVSGSNKASTHLEVKPLQTFSFLVHAYNGGDADCGETIVTDTLPSTSTFVACSDSCTNDGSTVTWTLANLAAGEARTLVVTVAAPDQVGADMMNVAVIDPANGAPVTVTDPGPEVTDQSVLAPPKPADLTNAANDQLPKTGGGFALLGIAGIAAASRLRRRS